MHEHSLWNHYRATGDSTRFRSAPDLQPLSEFHRTNLYNEVYRPLGHFDACGMFFPADDRAIVIVGFMTARPVQASQREMGTAVAAHLMQSYRNSLRVEGLLEDSRLMETVLDMMDSGVVVTDPSGKVRLETTRATGILSDYFDRRRDPGRLPDSVERWLVAARRIIATATDLPPPVRPMAVVRQARRLTIRCLLEPGRNVLILEEQPTVVDPARLAPLGLTRRQSEVLAYIAMGKTSADIAIILEMSRRTVEKHVEEIFTRLGVETRTAAAAMALEVMQKRPV